MARATFEGAAPGSGTSALQDAAYRFAAALRYGAKADHFYCKAGKLMNSPKRLTDGEKARRRDAATARDLRIELADVRHVKPSDIARLSQWPWSGRRQAPPAIDADQVSNTSEAVLTVLVRFARKPAPAARGALAVAGFVWDQELTGFVAHASHRTRSAAAICEIHHGAEVLIKAGATI